MISALLALTLAACPAKVPAWGVADDATVPRHGDVLQVVSDSKCRVYVLTRAPSSAVVRLDASGSLNSEFASNGVLSVDLRAEGLVLDEAHDRLIVYGSTNRADATQVELRAWNLEGVPKRAFGKAGVVHLEGRRLTATQASASGVATAVAFDDGAVLVVLQVASAQKDESAVYAYRLSLEGTLEMQPTAPSFITGAMAGGGPHLARVGTSGAWYFTSTGKEGLLARFDSHARLDADVGEAGVAKCGSIAYANALVTDGDGVLLGGTGSGYKQIIERRTGTGALDRTFGREGQIIFKADPVRLEHIRALQRTQAGVLAVFASYDHVKRISRTGLESWAFDGRLDQAYATHGVRWFSYGPPVTDGTAMTTDALGRIFVALNEGESLLDSKMRSHVVRVEPGAPLVVNAPAAKPETKAAVAPAPQVPEEIWEYTDEKGVTNYVNSHDAVPAAFRPKARRFR